MKINKLSLSEERTGAIGKNKFGSKMEVIKYKNTHEIWVKFEKGNAIRSTWQNFCNGGIKSLYDKSVYGIGYIGEGVYKVSEKKKSTKIYKTWQGMLQRCYDKNHHLTHPTYKGCSVAKEWHNFQIFAKWHDENYYEVDGEEMNLDKDILVKGNKIYSSETCVIVPKSINMLFVKKEAKRGNLPIGVSWNKREKYFTSRCGDNNGNIVRLGIWNTSEEAFKSYKSYKEKLIKETAEKYKGEIPFKLYDTMLNYEVEMTD